MVFINKIEEIRKKPEHIRRQYVYGAVAVSMLFILLIWITSLKAAFRSFSGQNNDYQDIKVQFENIRMDDIPSLQDALPQPAAEGIIPIQ